MRLYLIRHGESTWNSQRRIQGHADIPLSDIGRAQAARVAGALAGTSITAAFASDLGRAMETARIILTERSLDPIPVPDLREQHLGAFEGLTSVEAHRDVPHLVQGWRSERARFRPPGGESFEDVVERVRRFLESLPSSEDRHDVLIVAHGGSIRAMLYLVLGLHPQNGPWLRIDNGGITEVEVLDTEVRLHRFNETGHLAGLAVEGPAF